MPLDRVSPKRTPEPVRLLTAEDLLQAETSPNSNEPPLAELVVEGLLSFGDRTRFAFGRLNILVGPNGSGKSNLIECLRVLRLSPFDIQETFQDSGFEDWLYRGVSTKSGTAFIQVTQRVPGLTGPICHQLRLGPPINSRALLEEVVREATAEGEDSEIFFVGSHRSEAVVSLSGRGKRRRERTLDASEYDPHRSILSQIRDLGQYPEITRLANLYASFRIYSEWRFGRKSNLRDYTPAGRSNTTVLESLDDLALALNGLLKTAAHEKIQNLLRELKETYRDYVTPVAFGRVHLELVEAPFDKLPLPAMRLSDGTLRFLALAAILLQPDPPPLICLEEPELGMHPDMIRMVAGMIADASARSQLIVTTHSELLLSSLQDDFDVMFAFDAGVSGSIVRSFSREDYQSWSEEHTLGELWTSGELGGNRW